MVKNVSIYEVNGRNTSPDCKHKHMLENRVPPDKVGVMYILLHVHVKFHGF